MRVARSLRRHDLAEAVRVLETDFASDPDHGWRRHQFLLDALDRGELDRFALWPERSIRAMVYVGTGGTVVPAGDAEAGSALAAAADASSWRVLIGDAPVASAVVAASGRGMFRRRPTGREQRFMIADAVPSGVADPVGLRQATLHDLPRITDFACALHVEDQMGPPIPRSSRAGVRSRMRDSIVRGTTWVIDRRGTPLAKVDLSIASRRRGAQIAGVYVDVAHRGGGLATELIGAVTRTLLAAEMPAVTLHVRSDNDPAIRAYHRAGFSDHGPWVLALR
jgi:ribosomal protein S18 acetylase RimI-like enzyme